jgi:hypothetical protein
MFLGSLGYEGLEPRVNDNQIIPGEGISAEVALVTSSLLGLEDLYPIKTKNKQIGEVQLNFDQLKMLKALSATSLEVPRVYLSLTIDPEICGKHLPPDAQNFLGQLLYCFPYPEHDPNLGETTPQPYLVWDFDFFEPTCVGGVGEQCKSYRELLGLAEETDGQVGFDVQSISGGVINTWKVTEPDLTMFVAPTLKCLGDSQFSVRMWYRQGTEGSEQNTYQNLETGKFEDIVFYGPYSNAVNTPCDSSVDLERASIYPAKIPTQYLEITFIRVFFYNLDDGDLNEWFAEKYLQQVELYGYFRVTAPSMGQWEEGWDGPSWVGSRRYLLVADWEEDYIGNLLVVEEKKLGLTESDLQSEYLCLAKYKYSCIYEGQATSYKYDNNTIKVFVREGDALTFDMMLVDYDELSGDDLVCVGTIMTPSISLSEWEELGTVVRYEIDGRMTGSGRCDVEIIVKSVYGP